MYLMVWMVPQISAPFASRGHSESSKSHVCIQSSREEKSLCFRVFKKSLMPLKGMTARE